MSGRTIPCEQCNRPANPDSGDGLCDTCFDLRAEFEMLFVSAMRQHEEGSTGEALAALQRFLRDHEVENPSRRFERQAIEMAAHFLVYHGEDEVALQLFRHVAGIPGADAEEQASLERFMERLEERIGRASNQ